MDRPSASSRRGRARLFARAAAAAFAAAVALAFAAGPETMRLLDRAETGLRRRLGARFETKHGLVFYASMDAGIPFDAVACEPLETAGTRVVAGRFGEARRFDGRGGFLASGLRWSRFAGTGGTVFFWADLEDSGLAQHVVWDRATGVSFGLRLTPDRTLEAVFTDAGGERVLSAPFPPAGRFVPVGLVFGNDRVALWVDGREAAAAAVDGGLKLPGHVLSFGASESYPPAGAVDEASVWSRPLSAADLAALSSADRPLDVRLEPWRTAFAAAARAASRAFRTAARVLDRLVPARGGPAVLRGDVPELDLVLSKKDARHFVAAHERSLQAGCRTRGATRERAVLVGWKGRETEAFLSLDDAYGPGSPDRPEAVRRPSFLLRGPPGAFASGSGLARLVPPERFGTVHPDAPRPLPLSDDCLVRLLVDGGFRGIYVLEPFDAPGGGWRVSGARDGLRPAHLLYGSLPAVRSPAGGGTGNPEADEKSGRRVLSLLRSDPRFPWSGAEVRWRARVHAERRKELGFAPPALSALDLVGNNPSPFYVTNDVDLAAAGPGVAWRSPDPATLDVDGTVCTACCDGDLPRVVELTGTFPDGSERTFRFRVMPEKPRLPALFLHVPDPVRKDRRTDFAAVRIPAGGGAPEALSGTAATGGGLRHRGNTSYVRGVKRSLSLEFDRPVGWTGAPAPVSHVLLFSGYADSTRLRNALSFDAFAAMHPGAPRGAVPVSWTEVFVNGEWAGVWETSPRLRDMVSGDASAVYKVRTPDGLWSRVSADMLDRRDDPPAGEDPYAPFLELARFAVGSSDAAFAAGADAAFDLDDLADMLLLLDFTANMDGRITNQYVVRRRSDGRWLVLPWDYDKTFPELPSRVRRATNRLYDRCLRCVPGFADRVCARWTALRAGPLSDAALDRWIDEKAAFLAPFMEEEFRLVAPDAGPDAFRRSVEALREAVRYRARRLDGRFPPPSAP